MRSYFYVSGVRSARFSDGQIFGYIFLSEFQNGFSSYCRNKCLGWADVKGTFKMQDMNKWNLWRGYFKSIIIWVIKWVAMFLFWFIFKTCSVRHVNASFKVMPKDNQIDGSAVLKRLCFLFFFSSTWTIPLTFHSWSYSLDNKWN